MKTPSKKAPTPVKNASPRRRSNGIQAPRFSLGALTPQRNVATPNKLPRMTPSKMGTCITGMTPSGKTVPGKTHYPKKAEPTQMDEVEEGEGIIVAIRMRPLNSKESTSEGSSSSTGNRVWKVLPQYSSIAQTTPSGEPLSERVTGRTFFSYDKTFGEDSSTRNVYDGVAKNIVKGVVTGLNGTIFAYGQTSSGKTFTMQGSGSIEEGHTSGGGVVHMATKDIFAHIANTPDRMFLVRTSFIEIYNEEVRDLLGNNEVLQVREDPRRGVFVASNEEIVTDFDSLLEVLFAGEKNRAVASTGMNERSSRSHTIFRITIESRQRVVGENDSDTSEEALDMAGQSDDGAVRISTLNLVDLAGSESVRHTGSTGERQKEGGKINQSLLTLSRVIVALGQPNATHINFRDSKLTRILQPSLSGNARMAVICCATPSGLYLEETRSTLLFASRAKLVKTNAQVNEVLDDRSLIKRLQRELAEARKNGGGPDKEHVRALKMEAATAGTAAKEAEEKLQRLKSSLLNHNVLFGSASSSDTRVDEAPVANGRRKRRMSDGDLRPRDTLLLSPPAESIRQQGDHRLAVAGPRSESRAIRREKIARIGDRPLSPKSELSLLREAFTAKTDRVKTLERKVSESDNLVTATKSELSNAHAEAAELRIDRDAAKDECTSLAANINSLATEHGAVVSEKDATISDAFDKLEKELAEKAAMQVSLLKLQEKLDLVMTECAAASTKIEAIESEKDQLQERLDRVSQERVRSAFELAQAHSEKDRYIKEREEDKGRLQLMTATMQEAVSEKDEALDRVQELERNMCTLEEEKKSAQTEVESLNASLGERSSEFANLQSAFSDMKGEMELLKGVLEESTAKVMELTSESGSKNETIAQLQHQLGETIEQNTQRESTFEQEIAKHISEKEALQTMVNNLNSVVETLSTENDESATRQQELTTECEKSRAALAEATDSKAELLGKMETMEEERGIAETKINELEAQLAQSTEQNTALEEELLQLADRHDETVERLAEVENQKKENDAKMSQLSDDLEALRKDISTAQTENVELRERNEEIARDRDKGLLQLEETKAVLVDAVHKTEKLESAIEALTSKTDELQAKLETLGHEKDSATEEVAKLQTENRSLDDERKAHAAQIKMLASEKESLASDLVARQSTISEQSTQLQEITAASQEVKSKLQVAEEKIVELQATAADMESSKASFERKLHSMSSDMDGVNEQLASLGSEKRELEAQVKEMTKQVEALTREKSTALSQLADRDSSLSRLQLDHQAIVASLQETKQELDNENVKLRDRNVRLESTVTEFETRLEEVSNAKERTTEQLDRLQAEKYELEVKLETISTEKDSLLFELANRDSNMSQLQEENAALSVSVQESKELSEQAAQKNSRLENLISQLESDKARDVEEIKVKNLALTKQLQLSTMQVDALTTEKEDLVSKIAGLEASLSRLETERDSFIEMVKEAKGTIAKLMSSVEEMSSSAEKAEKLGIDNIELTSSLEAAKEKVRALEATNIQIRNEVEATKAKLSAAENSGEEAFALQKRVDALSNELSETKMLLADANEQVLQARDAALASDEELQQKEAELDDAIHMLDRREEELRSALESAAVLERHATEAGTNDKLKHELDLLCEEKNKLEEDLQTERADRKESEDELKRLAGEEQRLLIQQADNAMSELKGEVSNLREELAAAEADAYAARQAAEDCQEQIKCIQIKAAKREQELAALRDELVRAREVETRLKSEFAQELATPFLSGATGSDVSDILVHAMRMKTKKVSDQRSKAEADAQMSKRQILELEADISSMRTQLDSTKQALTKKERRFEFEIETMKAELSRAMEKNSTAKQDLLGLQDEIEREKRNAGEAVREASTLQEKVTKLEDTVAALEKTNEQLLGEVESAANDAAALGKKENSILQEKVKQMGKDIKSKDKRIQKLEKVRLTKEQCVALKKMKEERVKYLEEAERNKAELEQARAELALLKSKSSRTDGAHDLSTGDAEFSEMKFAKEALEKKLHKLASKCRQLEGEKVEILGFLHGCKQAPTADGDVVSAVGELCDMISSLEEQCGDVSNFEEKNTSYMAKNGDLQNENKKLQKVVSEAEESISTLKKIEKDLQSKLAESSEEVSLLRKEIKKLKIEAKSAKGTITELQSEKSSQLTYMEQENLQLMLELKQVKKELNRKNQDLASLQADGTVEVFTPASGAIDPNANEAQRPVPTSPDGKENQPIAEQRQYPLSARKGSTNKRRVARSTRSSKKKETATPGRKTVGLGEASEVTEGNTQECKQS